MRTVDERDKRDERIMELVACATIAAHTSQITRNVAVYGHGGGVVETVTVSLTDGRQIEISDLRPARCEGMVSGASLSDYGKGKLFTSLLNMEIDATK